MHDEILKLLNTVGDITKDEPSPERLVATAQILSSYPLEEVRAAILCGMETWTFFPVPAQIIGMIKDTDCHAENEWQLIMKHMRSNGYPAGYPKTISATSLRALEGLGRWIDLCQQKVDQLNFTKTHFIRAVSAMKKVEEKDRFLPGKKDSQTKTLESGSAHGDFKHILDA